MSRNIIQNKALFENEKIIFANKRNILKLSAKITRCAGIAQLVEQLIRNQQVASSTLVLGSTFSL